MDARQHRYLPSSLLQSQFDTLDEPDAAEHPATVTVQGSVAETVLNCCSGCAHDYQASTSGEVCEGSRRLLRISEGRDFAPLAVDVECHPHITRRVAAEPDLRLLRCRSIS